MIGNTRKRIGIAATLALLSATTDVFAQVAGGGTIFYGPPAESIPVLSGSMLIVLGMLLAVLAYRLLRRYPGGRPLASLVALAIVGFSGVSGTEFIQDAYGPAPGMDQAGGGSVYIGGTAEVGVPNISGRTQQIKSVTPDSLCSVGPASSPVCAPGVIVQPGSSCNVKFDCTLE
jgi:hypothetical protein